MSSKERLMKIILAPVITEKGTLVSEKYKQFVFEVLRDAHKPEIKEAVELLFDVKVQSVDTCNIKGKTKRFKQHHEGKRKDVKKAYVKLMPGYDISLASTEG